MLSKHFSFPRDRNICRISRFYLIVKKQGNATITDHETNPQHHEEETKNTNSHIKAKKKTNKQKKQTKKKTIKTQYDFNFEILKFPFLDGDVSRSPSYDVYISQLIRFARVCSNIEDFNKRNLFLTAKLLKQGYRDNKTRKSFSKFYHRHSELIVKYNIGLKTLLQQGISEPIFYGDLVYKFKRIVGKTDFSDQFKKIVKRYIPNKKETHHYDFPIKISF